MLMLRVCLAGEEVLPGYKYLTNKEKRIRGVKSASLVIKYSFNLNFERMKVLCCIFKTEEVGSDLPALQRLFTFLHFGEKK